MRPPTARPSSVNWDDPQLAALLHKSADWKLDHRSNTPELQVDIHVGWQATVGQHAWLLLEKDNSIVLASNFPLPPGTHVRVDRLLGEVTRSQWATVAESRKGQREQDGDTFIHWLLVSR